MSDQAGHWTGVATVKRLRVGGGVKRDVTASPNIVRWMMCPETTERKHVKEFKACSQVTSQEDITSKI